MAGQPPHDKADNGTAQVIALLNALGTRLLASEHERAQLKQALSDLEARAEQSERIFLTLQDRQSKIETQTRSHLETLDHAAQTAARIEEALAQQARLTRRLDKMHQERVQMLRKLERIEETVIETSEALNAKALVLLTDQNVAGQSGKPALPAEGRLPAPPANDDKPRFWHSRTALRSFATASVIALGAFCGWALYGTQIHDLNPVPYAHLNQGADTPPPAIAAAAPEAITTAAETAPSPAAAEETKTAAADSEIWRAPDEVLQEKFAQNPDSLAAELNAIAPAAIPSAAPQEKTTVPAPDAAQPPQPAPPAAFDQFIAGVKKDLPPLTARIQPDPALPPALQAMERKAFGGSAEAQHDLAAIYTAGHGGVPKDYARAAAWFTEAALHGVANARYNLGVLYHQGLGVPKDMTQAIRWYGAAAALNHPEAQYNLGIAHIEGIGTSYDPQAAATYFENAARQGIMEAAYNLGLIHENGLLGGASPERALYWYKQAADRGSSEAQAALDQLAKSLGLSRSETESYIGKAAAEIKPPAQGPAPAPDAPPVRKSGVNSLLPEDKVDIAAIASLIPPVTDPSLTSALAKNDKSGGTKNHALIAQVQEQLVRLGLYPGPADGRTGPQTEDAIRSYQTAHNLPRDGRASEALLLHLMTNENENFDAPPTDLGSRAE